MTLDEAIETMDRELRPLYEFLHEDYNKALELGIEALRVVKKWREEHRDLGFLLMPGETGE